jgi:hypothetical protein
MINCSSRLLGKLGDKKRKESLPRIFGFIVYSSQFVVSTTPVPAISTNKIAKRAPLRTLE